MCGRRKRSGMMGSGWKAEDVALLGPFQFLADEGGPFETDLHRGVAAALEPFREAENLGGPTRAIGTLDHDQPSGDVFKFGTRDAVAVEAAFGRGRDDDLLLVAFHDSDSAEMVFGEGLRGAGGEGRRPSARLKLSRSSLLLNSWRTSTCCFSTS